MEVKYHVEITFRSDKALILFQRYARGFTDGHAAEFFKGLLLQFVEEKLNPRPVAGLAFDGGQTVDTVWRQRAEVLILFDKGNGVDAEPGDSFCQPPVNHCVNFFAQHRVFPVQVGLFFMKHVEIVSLFAGYFFPHAAAENRAPVVGGRTVNRRFKNVVIAVAGVRVRQRLAEPAVLVASMIDHQINHHFYPHLSGLRYQVVHVLHIAKIRIHREVIGDVIAVIRHRRLIKR
nr:Uncharacterised protein [Raoultella sp. NCTC 9187]